MAFISPEEALEVLTHIHTCLLIHPEIIEEIIVNMVGGQHITADDVRGALAAAVAMGRNEIAHE